MDQGQRGAGNGMGELEGSLLPVIAILRLVRGQGRRRTRLAARQDLPVLVDQKQGTRLGGGLTQMLLEATEQDVDADHPDQGLCLCNGLGQGDHLPLSGEILIGA
ncbi:hypothetical protein D3C71_1422730 [compost metagenome]